MCLYLLAPYRRRRRMSCSQQRRRLAIVRQACRTLDVGQRSVRRTHCATRKSGQRKRSLVPHQPPSNSLELCSRLEAAGCKWANGGSSRHMLGVAVEDDWQVSAPTTLLLIDRRLFYLPPRPQKEILKGKCKVRKKTFL